MDFYDEQQNNPSATGVRLRINNDSNAPINNAKLRYYFHKDSRSYAVDAYYLAGATTTVTNINDNLAYFEIAIPSIPVGYYPDMAGFSLALHNADWSNRDKTQDYSYQATSSLAENGKVVLLSDDEIIFGAGPNVQLETVPGILRISGLKFSDSAWIEIKNVGSSAVALSDFQLVDADDSTFSLSGSLDVGEIFRICQNQTACGNVNKSQILSEFDWGNDGEAFLKQKDSIVSYVAWGQPGIHVDEAVNAGVWSNAQAFFPAETHVQDFNADYSKDVFFRLKQNKSGVNTDDWFSFTSNDNPAEMVSVPLPIKTSANKPVIKQIPGDDKVLFSWLPVQGVNSYRVVVRDQNNNDVYNLSTSNTSVSLALTQGLYSWTVVGDDEFLTEREINNVVEYNSTNIIIQLADINTSIYKQLKIHLIKARRDTKMLDLGYLGNSAKYSWDRPNMDADVYEDHEWNRCWAIAIEVMNHFYGGDLTQDEIVYYGHYKEEDPLLSPFSQIGGTLDQVTKTLKWALKTDRLNYGKGAPSYTTVKNAIDNNKLIYIGVPNHAMVIYGYVGDANNYAFYYAFVNNEGELGSSLQYNQPIEDYFIPDVTYGDVEMSDPLVHRDTDGDEISDYEEINRFGTNYTSADSDDDGIEDKREIYNFTINADGGCENCRAGIYFNDENLDYDLYEIRKTSDKNKNGILAPLDPDDDGDGIEDGLKGIDATIDMDVPEDYTIFGREYVRINDRVKCYNTSMASDSYCNIASSDENKFSYDISYAPVNIGVQAHVGNIDVKNVNFSKFFPGTHSNPTLRNFAVVHGNFTIYGVLFNSADIIKMKEEQGCEAITDGSSCDLTAFANLYLASSNPLDYCSMQNGAIVEGKVNLAYSRDWKKEFTYTYSTPMPTIPDEQVKIIRNGETYHLKDGDAFSTLRAEYGSTLIIEPGEMFVDKKFQIEPNATIRFAEPGKGTILHTNGSIIWKMYNGEPASNTQYWINAARGFKLVHHSSRRFYIEGLWAGTIYAPKAKVVMGQVNKTIYGRILGRDVVVHQNSNVYRVDFNPTDASQVAYIF